MTATPTTISAIDEIFSRTWDVVIVGTGIGGGTLGRRLAERGLFVLYLERGPEGLRKERHGLSAAIADPAARATRGYWPAPIPASVGDDEPINLLDTLGAGVGGTSVFYAAALERPARHDLETTLDAPHPTGGWPVSFDAFAPYLSRAEELFAVCGEPDPLGEPVPGAMPAPPPLSSGDEAIKGALEASGLHPYRLHIGIRYIEGCHECVGRKCPLNCKMDGRSAGVEPALKTGFAALLNGFTVTALEGRTDRITAVRGIHDGREVRISGRMFVLAAGGLGSPALLLASANDAWPTGCANSSGLVGRNLMFHLNELVALWPPSSAPLTRPAKTLSLRDFYFVDGERFGLLQSLGLNAEYGLILAAIRERLSRSRAGRTRIARELARLPALVTERLLGSARIFAALIEDLPYPENRVTLQGLDQDSLEIRYTFSDELLARRKRLRRLLLQRLKPARAMLLSDRPSLNFGHPCGTLRFGDDPASSVTDPDGRAHDIANLYIADSSFMPTSTGVNPSLTIAAQSLRVADAIATAFSEDAILTA